MGIHIGFGIECPLTELTLKWFESRMTSSMSHQIRSLMYLKIIQDKYFKYF